MIDLPGPVVLVDDVAHPQVAPGDMHHLGTVLRLRPGDELVVADGAGAWAAAEFGPEVIRCGEIRREKAPSWRVGIAFAPAKGDRPEWAVQKVVECGADDIVAIRTERSVVRWDGDRATKAIGRLRRVAAEATTQCRRAWAPVVHEPMDLVDALTMAAAVALPGSVMVADPGGPPLLDDARWLFIGPEGGWSDSERAAVAEASIASASISANVLRAETAAVVGAAMLAGARDRSTGST